MWLRPGMVSPSPAGSPLPWARGVSGWVEAAARLKRTEAAELRLWLTAAAPPGERLWWHCRQTGGSDDVLVCGPRRFSCQSDAAARLGVHPVKTSARFLVLFREFSAARFSGLVAPCCPRRCTGTPARTSWGRPWSSSTAATCAAGLPSRTGSVTTCSSKTGNAANAHVRTHVSSSLFHSGYN